MIDIDHFKQINDRHGHAVGDEVIAETARRLAAAVRARDVVCRWGGEEFAVLLPGSSGDVARAVARRLHACVGEDPIATAVGPLTVTVSVGLAASEGPHSLAELLQRADGALYDAKRSGRDRMAVG
jgi:diguanylate cyclase (GGDEF)-like protein